MSIPQVLKRWKNLDGNRGDDPVQPPLRVCLVTEGSYPHYRGGVSTWCHMLIGGMPEVRFVLMSFVADPGAEVVFELPDNVDQLITVPLWGTGEVLELQRDLRLRQVLRHKMSAPSQVIEHAFLPLFERFLDHLWSRESDATAFATLLQDMAGYFSRHDYDVTLRSRLVWDAFLRKAGAAAGPLEAGATAESATSLLDVTDTMRLLYRWLTMLAVPVPDVDIVHAASGGLCSIPGIVAAGRPATSFLLTEHGIYLRERLLALSRSPAGRFEQLFQAAFTQRVTEAGYAVAAQISPGSNYNHRWEIYNGACPAAIETIYNGPDPAEFTPAHPQKPEGAPATITWLGRIDPLKDVETLIQAASIVVDAEPDTRFILYGKAPKGNEWYETRCLALRDDLALQDNVVFGGFAASAAAAYNEGDFVVLSSISEGFPYSVVEAMMCGRAVVGTDVGGVSEALEGCGLVVEPRNPEDMAAAMLRLIREPDLARLFGERARRKALEHFTVHQCNAAYLATYQRLAREARTRPACPEMPAPSRSAEVAYEQV